MFSIFLLVLRRHDGQIQSDPTAMLFVILLNLGENNKFGLHCFTQNIRLLAPLPIR